MTDRPTACESGASQADTKGARGNRRRWLAITWTLSLLLVLAFTVDSSVDQWAATQRAAGWQTAAKLCSRYLAWHWLMGAALAGLLLSWAAQKRELMRVLCVMMIAASLAGLSADVLRGLTGRTRPYADVPQGFYGIRSDSRWLITKHAYNSFPSGHTAAMTGFVFPLLLWRRRLLVIVVPLVAVVAAARVYLGAHHVSDTVAAAILGSFVAILVWSQFESRQLLRRDNRTANRS